MMIDELYDLIINNPNEQDVFERNIELWKKFYEDRVLIIRKNITNEKLYVIIKFLLKNENKQIFEYFQSNLLDTLLFEEDMLTFKLRNNAKSKDKPIELLLNTSINHRNLSIYLTELEIPQDGITNSSVSKYQSNAITIDIIESLIMVLHQEFFDIESILVHKTVDYIEKEIDILSKKSESINLLDLNLVYQYIDKFIPIIRYIGKDINDSTIITQIVTGEIQDKKIITKFMKSLKIKEALSLFDYDLNKFIIFIDNLKLVDDVYKQSLMYQIISELLKEGYYEEILILYINQNDNQYLKRCLDEETIDNLIKLANNDSPAYQDIKIINYLLDNDLADHNFFYNLKELTSSQKTEFTEEELVIIKNKLKESFVDSRNYSMSECINLIDNYLAKKITLTKEQTKQIMKNLTKELNKHMNLEEIDVYFIETDKCNGEFFRTKNIKGINLSLNLIDNFLDSRLSLENRTYIFTTILHELRHHEQYSKNIPLTYFDYLMKKENYLKKYDTNYYENNYQIVTEEIDARVESYNMLSKFFESFLPNNLNDLQESIISSLKKELLLKNEQNKKVEIIKKNNIDFDLSFDTLIKYNKTILETEPIFYLEYHQDGTPKSIDELLLSMNEKNAQIIDEILKKRYQYNIAEKQVENYIK